MRSYSELVEILRERELELFTIRRNFEELYTKFSQLEKAFAINLGVHRALESELAIYKLGKSSREPVLQEESTRNVARDNVDESSKARTNLYSSLNKSLMEKERCEKALRYQQKVVERQKLQHQKAIDTMRKECESILQNCRKNGEKQFGELLKIYEDIFKKFRISQTSLTASRVEKNWTRERILRVASIFESLQRIKDVRIQSICEAGTSVLTSLADGSENLYENSIEKLRQYARDMEGNCENQSLEFLQKQNSVLCHIVKNLRRKANLRESCSTEEYTEEIKAASNADRQSVLPRVVEEKKCEKSMNNEMENAVVKLSPSRLKTGGVMVPRDEKNYTENEAINEKMKNFENCASRSCQLKKSVFVEALESHRNGIRYEEYTFHFFNERELRVRHSNDVGIKSPTLVIEFVDTEQKFQEAPIERTVFFLGKDVKEIVNFSKSVMHCGVQTKRRKFHEKFVQTTITGSNGFFRSNAGVTMLNSEKRAIERSVKYLESTVANLKGTILGQAQSMVGCDVEHLGNEFFDCVRRLENSK